VKSFRNMTVTFVIAACAFAAVLGALVAGIDWWREARLTVVRPVARARVPVVRSTVPAARKRAA
jgi:ABC-type amino acid transport system permease subunit